MSIQAVSWVLENSQSTGSARLVLISLANHASEKHDGECWPASRTIAQEAGVKAHTTVLRAMEELVELGEVEIISRGDQRRPARYRLTFVCGASRTTPRTSEVRPDAPLWSTQTHQNRNEPEGTVKPAPLARDELFEALAEVCAWSLGGLTKSARGQLNNARKQLADLGADADDVRAKAKAYRTVYPGMALTPSALTKHWPALDNGQKPEPAGNPSGHRNCPDCGETVFIPGSQPFQHQCRASV